MADIDSLETELKKAQERVQKERLAVQKIKRAMVKRRRAENRLKQFRRIATRYDKTRKSFLAFLNLAAVKLWLPSFVNRT